MGIGGGGLPKGENFNDKLKNSVGNQADGRGSWQHYLPKYSISA